MASIKVKFRPSKIEGKEGTIFYQIIHDRITRQISTDYKIYSWEWDDENEIRLLSESKRNHLLINIKEHIKIDIDRLNYITTALTRNGATFSANDIAHTFLQELKGVTFYKFTLGVIARLRELRKERCVETYTSTLKSFMRFREGEDLLMTEFSSDLLINYETYLKYEGVSMNTISFYMRILRAIYNRAVDYELTEQKYPFKKVYTGVGKTIKRAIHIKYLKKLKGLNLSTNPSLAIVRDMFLFSFYTRGMSFIDMAFLRNSDIKGGILTYRRRKTGQQLRIKIENCMQEIIDRHNTNDTIYLLPIIKNIETPERNQYKNSLVIYNKRLKELGKMVGLSEPLTMYVARHTWASVAKNKNIPISVISEGMGHDSESTTQIYLASLDTSVVDKANNLILKLL